MKITEYNSIVGVIPKEGSAGLVTATPYGGIGVGRSRILRGGNAPLGVRRRHMLKVSV